MAAMYQLSYAQLIPAPLPDVWQFFADPRNLARITPPYMRFRITDYPEDAVFKDGMLIRYKVSPLLGIPLTWITRIEAVRPLQEFVDIQLKGPFTLWEHTHTFEEKNGQTLMKDHVRYLPPLGTMGSLAHVLFLRRQLEGIFSFREKVIKEIFAQNNPGIKGL